MLFDIVWESALSRLTPDPKWYSELIYCNSADIGHLSRYLYISQSENLRLEPEGRTSVSASLERDICFEFEEDTIDKR